MAAGAVLVLAALLLSVYNRHEDERAGKEAESILLRIEAVIEELNEQKNPSSAEDVDRSLPVVEMDGYGYVGYLTIPELERKLPVMAEWTYEQLKIAPCREFGSSRSDDLVIAAHNYTSHFGKLQELKEGSEVIFTDMDGIVNEYTVKEIKITDPYDVEAVQKSGYALVLYTCTLGGKSRVTVFCSRE